MGQHYCRIPYYINVTLIALQFTIKDHLFGGLFFIKKPTQKTTVYHSRKKKIT